MGVVPGTGIGVAMAGRDTPLMRPMRSRAEAIVAPVLPAETMAEALWSRTASAARTSDESFLVRTPGARVVAHADDLGRGDHVELTAERLQDLGPPDEDDGDTQLGGGALRPLDDGVGSVVAAHGVDGDGQQSP